MNTPTLVASLIMAAVLAALAVLMIRAMMRGWLRRARRQAELIGKLPALPNTVGPAIIPATSGQYVGSTVVPDGLIVVGDLAVRTKAVMTRYPDGVMLQRRRATPIWIPDESIAAIHADRGVLGIRWRLPSGTEIDTGFRGDDRRKYADWVST